MNEWGPQLENRFHRDEYDSVWRWRGRRGPNLVRYYPTHDYPTDGARRHRG